MTELRHVVVEVDRASQKNKNKTSLRRRRGGLLSDGIAADYQT